MQSKIMSAHKVVKQLKTLTDPAKALSSKRFFKPGYSKGDLFLGVTVPDCRKVSKELLDLPLVEVQSLLGSKWHEIRLTGLVILTEQFQKAGAKEQKQIFDFYMTHTEAVNNWDLVDVSAHKIVGEYLFQKYSNSNIDVNVQIKMPKELVMLSKSKNMWERRIAMVATFPFIKNDELDYTYWLAEKYLSEKHDLMHKVTGWLLREVGKKDRSRLEEFIKKYYNKFPRTALRYAIEKFSENKRKEILAGKFS